MTNGSVYMTIHACDRTTCTTNVGIWWQHGPVSTSLPRQVTCGRRSDLMHKCTKRVYENRPEMEQNGRESMTSAMWRRGPTSPEMVRHGYHVGEVPRAVSSWAWRKDSHYSWFGGPDIILWFPWIAHIIWLKNFTVQLMYGVRFSHFRRFDSGLPVRWW